MGRRYFVYKHTTPCGKSYIGITTNSIRERIRAGYRRNTHFGRAIQKYGWKNIQTEILAENVTRAEASLLESYYIKSFDTQNPEKGYNLADGGINPMMSREETWEKISAAAKKRHRPMREETRGKLRERAHKKPVRNVDTGEEYPSINAAARAINGSFKHIADVCHGRRKIANGYRWEFCNG